MKVTETYIVSQLSFISQILVFSFLYFEKVKENGSYLNIGNNTFPTGCSLQVQGMLQIFSKAQYSTGRGRTFSHLSREPFSFTGALGGGVWGLVQSNTTFCFTINTLEK